MTQTKITIFHKTDRDNIFDPYEPGHAVEKVFEFEAELPTDLDPDGARVEVAERAFAAFNGQPDPEWFEHTQAYYAQENRSLSVGDLVVVGDVVLAVDRFGFARTEIR
jgi:hypothetical protein